jgi:GT2 family glycosyltransferase
VDLSICMLAWNGIDFTLACLASIPAAVGRLKIETILVDNGSTDGSPDAVAKQFPGVKLVRNDMNCGFSIAVNQGVDLATGRYLLVLNNDTRIVPGSLEAVVSFMDQHPDAGIVTPQLIYEDGRLQNSIANFPSFQEIFIGKTILRLLFPGKYPSKLTAFTQPVEVESVVGAAMFVRKEVVDKIGGIDEGFFIFFEETDWCLRSFRAGWKAYLLPDAKLIHHQGQTVNRAHVRKRIEYTRSLFRYFRKNHPALSPWLRLLFPIKNCIEAAFSSLAVALTLGFSGRARRRCVEKWGTLLWQIQGCPETKGLRPDNLRVPPGRERLRLLAEGRPA